MTKKLTKHGNSLALIIDKPLLKFLKIDENTPLELLIEGNTLIIKPVQKKVSKKLTSKKNKEVEEIADQILKKYKVVFEKLAKT